MIGKLTAGNMVKFIYRRRVISSATLYPYALRFARNGLALTKLGITAPITQQIWHIPNNDCHIVFYKELPGTSLRDLYDQNALDDEIWGNLAAYLAKLHQLGIYFHSLHLANVLLNNQQDFSLLDIANLKIYNHPVSAWVRSRNLVHLFNHRNDSERLDNWGKKRFFNHYIEAADLAILSKTRLLKHMNRKLNLDL